MKKLILLYALLCASIACAQGNTTEVKISLLQDTIKINPMIYGQMLEDCNAKVIYGGLVNEDGSIHKKVNSLLKDLNIPVMRWPAGTYIHEYDWKKGIGPMNKRPQVPCHAWGGVETNQFGTDEFLQWCESMNIAPYINFNMSNDPEFAGSLGEALDWIEYVRGDTDTVWGKRRALNGREQPYDVKYWCLGNENYSNYGKHLGERAEAYVKRFNRWAKAIRALYPDLILMGVGHKSWWNNVILHSTGKYIDIITIHFYIHVKVKNGEIYNPKAVLFAPEKVEWDLQKTIKFLDSANKKFERHDNPITISIDEWNTRHNVSTGGDFAFSRGDPRKVFDVAIVAGMLNVFVRQSEHISMANYIFPVNGHGLIKTEGEDDAFATAIYDVFKIYRELMIGSLANVEISGAYSDAPTKNFHIEGDLNEADVLKEFDDVKCTFIDSSAALRDDGILSVVLLNRNHEDFQEVSVTLPDGYKSFQAWAIFNDDISDANISTDREKVKARKLEIKANQRKFTLPPCGLMILECKK